MYGFTHPMAASSEKAFDGESWYSGSLKAPGQSVSATAWVDPKPHIRVYVTEGGKIVEYCWDDNGPWRKGGFTL
jgi:hypothetical protein